MIGTGAITALGAGILLFCCSFPGHHSPDVCQRFIDLDVLRIECGNLINGVTILQNGLTLEETAFGRAIKEANEEQLTKIRFSRNIDCVCIINETLNVASQCQISSKHFSKEEGDHLCKTFLPTKYGTNAGYSKKFSEHEPKVVSGEDYISTSTGTLSPERFSTEPPQEQLHSHHPHGHRHLPGSARINQKQSRYGRGKHFVNRLMVKDEGDS